MKILENINKALCAFAVAFALYAIFYAIRHTPLPLSEQSKDITQYNDLLIETSYDAVVDKTPQTTLYVSKSATDDTNLITYTLTALPDGTILYTAYEEDIEWSDFYVKSRQLGFKEDGSVVWRKGGEQ